MYFGYLVFFQRRDNGYEVTAEKVVRVNPIPSRLANYFCMKHLAKLCVHKSALYVQNERFFYYASI